MRTLIVGHRGNPVAHPENSIAGILSAREHADMAEIDIRPTADRRLALSHDPVHHGRVIVEHPLADFPDLGTLDGLLGVVGEFPLNIEIKNWPDDPDFDSEFGFALDVGRRARSIDLITCFHWPTVAAVRRAGTDAATGVLVDRGGDLEAALTTARTEGHQAIAPHWTLMDDAVGVVEAAGDIDVNVWTVNNEDVARRLIAAGVNAIITDDPAGMRALAADSTDSSHADRDERGVEETA